MFTVPVSLTVITAINVRGIGFIIFTPIAAAEAETVPKDNQLR
jgi:hypothetical protein